MPTWNELIVCLLVLRSFYIFSILFFLFEKFIHVHVLLRHESWADVEVGVSCDHISWLKFKSLHCHNALNWKFFSFFCATLSTLQCVSLEILRRIENWSNFLSHLILTLADADMNLHFINSCCSHHFLYAPDAFFLLQPETRRVWDNATFELRKKGQKYNM